MKRFNVTGLCVPHKHYMADISGKIAEIKSLVDRECYFTINRARQYGKTTTLFLLQKELTEHYIPVAVSFEGLGDENFESAEKFCSTFLKLIVNALSFTTATEDYVQGWADYTLADFDSLSRHITKMCKGKKVVLMIDEVDRTSNNRTFLHFLGVLRKKYLEREAGRDHTFHSVILAGVYDIKNIKLKMVEEGSHVLGKAEGKIYNSPWNIAVSFNVDMAFNPTEIASMLAAYENDHQTGMNIMGISEEIYGYTSGYPFLVSRICQCIDEELGGEWTVGGVHNAVQILINEQNTLFDDIFKNMENNTELSDMIYELLIMGEEKPYVVNDSIVGMGIRYGFFKKGNGSHKLTISNKVFEFIMTNYFVAKDLRRKKRITWVLQNDLVRNGRFDMELCLRKFAEHYAEIYSEHDMAFLERHGRLLFLSYLKPLINGQGFYHIESQFTDLRRMDLVVDYGRQQFIIELKVWRGEQYHREAHAQLNAYLESKNAHEGYLLTFDFRKEGHKTPGALWRKIGGKRIFDVIV
ncbi:MAG: AAA-like domain-containing protein [Peptococcaceae bacterium]|nr:AAA-like domain-containing protein [Peptococcaceae bacterium]